MRKGQFHLGYRQENIMPPVALYASEVKNLAVNALVPTRENRIYSTIMQPRDIKPGPLFVLLAMGVYIFWSIAVSRQPTSVYRMIPRTEMQLEALRECVLGDYWKRPTAINETVEIMIHAREFYLFKVFMYCIELDYELAILDFDEFLKNANLPAKNIWSKDQAIDGNFDWLSYHNLEEIYEWLDSLAQRYPNNVKVIVGGRTYEGREIKGVHLYFGQNKAGIFIEGGIHAREWISPATVTYLINQLLISDNSDIRQLAESHDWYIFPVFNPDGYAYSHINPASIEHRWWRKNRSSNKDSSGKTFSYGTDMNRNWDAAWKTIGGSSDPDAQNYAGISPFSEIETKTLSEYITSISDKLFAYISFHSYHQVLLFPYLYTKDRVDNYNEQLAICEKAISAISKRYGTIYTRGNDSNIFKVSGTSFDWVKTKFNLPMVFLYELRTLGNGGLHGFVLPTEQIIPTGEETMDSLIAMFEEGKKYGYPSQ